MATPGGRPCATVTMYKDLGEEIDVVKVNKPQVPTWEKAGYSTTAPDDLKPEEPEDLEELEDDDEVEE